MFKPLRTTTLAAIFAAPVLTPFPAAAAEPETLVVAGGCFWCVEADFEKVTGVKEAVSGFAGGRTENPTYKEVTGGDTGHYEVVEITYDPAQVSEAQLLSLFFRSIDPTDAGGQFCDRGDSYRTAVFADDAETRSAAEAAKAEAEKALGQEIVTPILDGAPFYPAEDYHQDYYKSSDRLAISSVGIGIRKSEAYKKYRAGCGRDARVRELWGKDAPFAGQPKSES